MTTPRRAPAGTVRLTLAERNHLLTLLHERAEDGSYYGNREQYYDRTQRLISKLGTPADRRGELMREGIGALEAINGEAEGFPPVPDDAH